MRSRKLFNSMAAALNKVYLQVVGCGTIDTTPSLLLFTDSKRYLFNCGEGTQRLFNEHKLRIHKLNNIFFTRISWECTGGLPGMAMTLRDTGKIELGLYGPQGFMDFMHATRHFLYQEKLQVKCTEFSSSENKFEDENISICPVLLAGKTPVLGNDLTISKEDDDTEDVPSKRIKTHHVKNIVSYICSLPTIPGKFLVNNAKELGVPKGPLFGKLKLGEDVFLNDGRKILAKDVTEPAQTGPVFFIIDCPSVDYIPMLVMSDQFEHYKDSENHPCLILHLVPMEVFDNQRYKEWRLSFGESTQHLLISKEVSCGSSVFRSQARIQMKLHTVDKFLFPLLYSSDKPIHDLNLLPKTTLPGKTMLKFHLRPLKLQGFDSEDIPSELDIDTIMSETINIIKETGNKQHIALINNNLTIQDKLEGNLLDETCYANDGNLSKGTVQCGVSDNKCSDNDLKVLQSNDDHKTHDNNSKSTSENTLQVASISRNTLLEEHSVPLKDNDSDMSLTTEQFQIIDNEKTFESVKSSKEELGTNEGPLADGLHFGALEKQEDENKGNNDFQVVFIGTGASLPSKYRNVSATLLRISDSSSILFDCGEGTLGQLYRHYGSDMDNIINTINCIFISHIHADHHLGLIRILLYKSQLRNETNDALTPDETVVIGPKKVGLWLQEYSSLFEYLNYRFVHCSEINTDGHSFVDLFKQNQESELIAVPVVHCADAYGLVLTHVSGWKVVYSGDTRPCPDLASAGQGATLLIHEATFEDELQDEAVNKKHCTTTEAINMGIEMNAAFIMLNHFSQRYPKIPVISEQFTKHTGIAFDHMRVRPRDFERIPSLFSVLNVIFAEEVEEMSKKNRK